MHEFHVHEEKCQSLRWPSSKGQMIYVGFVAYPGAYLVTLAELWREHQKQLVNGGIVYKWAK